MSLQSKVDALVEDVKYEHRRGIPYTVDLTPHTEPVIEEAVAQGRLEVHYVEPRKFWGERGRREARLTPVIIKNGVRRPTYNEAKGKIWEYLEDQGWRMSRHDLRVPHATDPRSGAKVWFKPQALYVGYDSSFKSARSLGIDVRSLSRDQYPDLERRIQRMAAFLEKRDEDL